MTPSILAEANRLANAVIAGSTIELRYEKDGSSKYWQALARPVNAGYRSGSWTREHRWGRIGASPQGKPFHHGSEALCREAVVQAITEKIGKGYRVHSAPAHAALQPPRPTDPWADVPEIQPTRLPREVSMARLRGNDVLVFEGACLLRPCLDADAKARVHPGQPGFAAEHREPGAAGWRRCCSGIDRSACPRKAADPKLGRLRDVPQAVVGSLMHSATTCRADLVALAELVASALGDGDTGGP